MITRSYEDLTRAEANAVLEAYVRDLPGRLDRFPATLARMGGPVSAIERGPDGLEQIWGWLVASQRLPAVPLTEEQLDAWQHAPWWVPFHPPWAQELGVDLSDLATGLAAHLATTVLRERPGSRWVLGKGRSNAYFQHPMLDVEEGSLHYVDGTVIIVMFHAFGGRPDARRRAKLRELYDDWIFVVPPQYRRPAAPDLRATVEDSPGGAFTHQVGLSDDLAARRTLVRRVIKSLRAMPGVLEVHEEDRELLLVSAPGISAPTLQAAVNSALGTLSN